MLRGTPRVSPPGDLKTSLFAAYARRQDVRTSGAGFRALRERLAFPVIVTASAAAVLLAGAFLRDGSGDRSRAWVQLHPATAATATRTRVVDVDDPSLDVFGRTGTFLAAVPPEGP